MVPSVRASKPWVFQLASTCTGTWAPAWVFHTTEISWGRVRSAVVASLSNVWVENWSVTWA